MRPDAGEESQRWLEQAEAELARLRAQIADSKQ